MLKHLVDKRLPLFVEFFRAFMRYTSYVQEVILTLLFILFLGAILIWRYENISFGNAIYFTLITGLSIGYGDISSETTIGKIVSIGVRIIGFLSVGNSQLLSQHAHSLTQ